MANKSKSSETPGKTGWTSEQQDLVNDLLNDYDDLDSKITDTGLKRSIKR